MTGAIVRLIGLFVDDGFLAAAILVAVALASALASPPPPRPGSPASC